MVCTFKKKCSILTLLICYSKLLSCSELTMNIKDVCELSTERYPDNEHNVSSILKTYENCFHKLDQYSGLAKENIMKQLTNKLECFKEDLKQSYYEGHVRYNNIELVENLEAEMQNKGINFSFGSLQPTSSKCNFARSIRSTTKHIIPLVVTGTSSEKQKACEAIFKETKGGNISLVDIPTPKFDSNKEPKELILPLAQPTTYKVDSPEAENALTHFYKVVMKCLTLTNEHKIQVFRFNRKFYDWLTQAVLPHLKDDKCYPAFGGVLRIVETMRQNDFVPKNATANFIFYRQKDLGKCAEEHRKKEDNTSKLFKSPYFLLIVIPWLLFILLFLMFLAWRTGRCMNCCCTADYDDEACSHSTEVFYYPIEETPSVSLDLDDISSKPDHSQKSDDGIKMKSRQKGGDDLQVYSMTYEQENALMGLPLKRQWTSKDSSSSQNVLISPGKRQKHMW